MSSRFMPHKRSALGRVYAGAQEPPDDQRVQGESPWNCWLLGAILALLGSVLLRTGPATAQLTDLTQTPNAESAGIHKSLAEQNRSPGVRSAPWRWGREHRGHPGDWPWADG